MTGAEWLTVAAWVSATSVVTGVAVVATRRVWAWWSKRRAVERFQWLELPTSDLVHDEQAHATPRRTPRRTA